MDAPEQESPKLTEKRIEEIRNFATVVGCVLIGFTLLASLYHSYHAPQLRWILRRPTVGGVGVAILALGFLTPSLLDYPERLWMRLAHFLGFWNTRILLTLTFFLILTPLGLVARLFGWDKLRLKKPKGVESYYEKASEHLADTKHFEHPF